MESDQRSVPSGYDRRQVRGRGPYEVEIAGALDAVRFPALCASCGGGEPGGTLRLWKLFRRDHDDDPDRYRLESARVPFCGGCIAAHEAALRPPDPRVLRRLRNRWILSTLPYWIPIGVILWLAGKILPPALDALGGADRAVILAWLGVVLFFGVVLAGFVRLVLAGRRRQIAEHAGDRDDPYVQVVRGPLGVVCVIPGPPTPVLAAVDFSDEEVELLDRNRRTFTFRNLDVATAFAAANAELVWQPNSPRAIRARWAARAVGVGVVVIGLLLMLSDWLGP